jgi:hypothetical protein
VNTATHNLVLPNVASILLATHKNFAPAGKSRKSCCKQGDGYGVLLLPVTQVLGSNTCIGLQATSYPSPVSLNSIINPVLAVVNLPYGRGVEGNGRASVTLWERLRGPFTV